MEKKFGTNIVDSVERIFRYIIPGVAFCILFTLSYPKYFDVVINKISDNELFVFFVILTVGMTLYTLESQIIRFTLEPIAYWLNMSPVNLFSQDRRLCNYSKAHAKLLMKRHASSEYPKEYYIYLWSIIHYAFILSASLIIFACNYEKESWTSCNVLFMNIGGLIILSLAVCSYFYMQVLEKNTADLLNQPINN